MLLVSRAVPGRTRLARALKWVASSLLLVGCISPTLPPDDPPLPEVEIGEGTVLLSGVVPPAPASVFVRNRATDLIYGQFTPSGAYHFEILAGPCDPLSLWYSAGDFSSAALRFAAADLTASSEVQASCESGEGGDEPAARAADELGAIDEAGGADGAHEPEGTPGLE